MIPRLCLIALLFSVSAEAQEFISTSAHNIDDEICGDGVDNSQSGHTKGACPVGWASAPYSDGCEFLCAVDNGNDDDQDGWPSSGETGRTEGVAAVNGNQNNVNTIVVDTGFTIRPEMFVTFFDADSSSTVVRRVLYTHDTADNDAAVNLIIDGAPVDVTDDLPIVAYNAVDPDDTNRDIIPGSYYPCDAGGGAKSGYEYASYTGSFGACQSNGTCPGSATPLDESGAGVGQDAYYVHCGTGSDVTGDGSYCNPWGTPGMVSGGSAANEPAGAVTPGTGDVVYFMGDTNCTTTINSGGDTAIIMEITGDGTAEKPVLWKRYPGAETQFVNTNGQGITSTGGDDYHILEDLMISTQSGGSGDASGGHLNASKYVTLRRMKVHHTEMNGNNNNACWRFDGGAGPTGGHNRIYNSVFWDCDDASGAVLNISAVKYITDDDTGVVGNYIGYNVMGADVLGEVLVREKHGTDSDDDIGVGFVVERNILESAALAVMWDGSNLDFKQNLVYNATKTYYSTAPDESNDQGGNKVRNNTFVKSSTFNPNSTDANVADSLTFTDNVLHDDVGSYSLDRGGIMSLWGGESDTKKDVIESNNNWIESDNCFWNSATSVIISYFSTNSSCGAETPCGEGVRGDLAAYQAESGQGANDVVGDPLFDAYFQVGALSTCYALGSGRTFTTDNTPPETPTNGSSRTVLNRKYRLL